METLTTISLNKLQGLLLCTMLDYLYHGLICDEDCMRHHRNALRKGTHCYSPARSSVELSFRADGMMVVIAKNNKYAADYVRVLACVGAVHGQVTYMDLPKTSWQHFIEFNVSAINMCVS